MLVSDGRLVTHNLLGSKSPNNIQSYAGLNVCAGPNISAMSGMTEEPDILVMILGEVVLIVECTTGVPDDNKLTMLISRVARVPDSLQRSQGADISATMFATLICSLPSEELVGVRAKAAHHSVIVLCKPDLKDAFTRTTYSPDPTVAHIQDRPDLRGISR
jgi:hypothetical protein